MYGSPGYLGYGVDQDYDPNLAEKYYAPAVRASEPSSQHYNPATGKPESGWDTLQRGWDNLFGGNGNGNGTSDPYVDPWDYPESQSQRESQRGGVNLSEAVGLLRAKQVRSPSDLVSVVRLVFDGVQSETGKWNQTKFNSLKTQAANATTIPQKVAVFQALAAYAQNNKSPQIKDAISKGVAYEFWQNVESPASGVPVKSGGTGKAASKSVEEMLKLPFYRESWFAPTVGIAIAATILAVWKPWK
jgi:hypothetical protein